MISHDEIKAKALAEINSRRFLCWRLGDKAEMLADDIANSMLYDHAHYRSTGATESARQMMAGRVGASTKALCGGDIYGFDPITLFIIGILLNAVIRILIDWWFSKQVEQAKQEH